MGHGEGAVLGVHYEGLAVDFFGGGARGVPGVADADASLQLADGLVVEDVAD